MGIGTALGDLEVELITLAQGSVAVGPGSPPSKPDLRVKRCANPECTLAQVVHRDGRASRAFLRIVVECAALHAEHPFAAKRC